MTRALALALFLDWALILPNQPPICSVDQASCLEAIQAIRAGYLRWTIPDAPLRCIEMPNCRPTRELCIPGYRGSRAEGYCPQPGQAMR